MWRFFCQHWKLFHGIQPLIFLYKLCQTHFQGKPQWSRSALSVFLAFRETLITWALERVSCAVSCLTHMCCSYHTQSNACFSSLHKCPSEWELSIMGNYDSCRPARTERVNELRMSRPGNSCRWARFRSGIVMSFECFRSVFLVHWLAA